MSVDFYPARFIPVTDLPESVREHVGPGPIVSFIEELHEDHNINMHNAGAGRVLEVLGYDRDECGASGHAEAEDFLGRALVALGAAPHDEGMPAHRLLPGEGSSPLLRALGGGGASVWVGEVEAGDLQRRLRLVADLATFCSERGFLVAWS